jgi:hypothetical protein
MGFLDQVTVPAGSNQTSAPTPTGTTASAPSTGFLSKISAPTPESLAAYNTPAPAGPASLASRIGTGLKQTITAPLTKQSFNPLDTIDAIGNTAYDTLKDTNERFGRANITEGKSTSEIIGDKASALLGVANLAFTPITAVLKGLETVPAVGYVATAVNRLFGSLGVVGGEAAVSGLDALPVSDETKKSLEGPVREVGALLAQLAGSKVGTKGYDTIKTKIAEKTAPVENIVKAEMEKAKTGPTDTPSTVEDISKESPFLSKVDVATGRTPEPTATTAVPTAGEGATRTSGLAESLKKDSDAYAVDNGVKVDFGELPEYQTRPVKAQEAVDYVKNNLEEAQRVIEGETPAPDGLLLGEVYSALKVKAIKEGDVALQLKLAKSKANDVATEYGRNVKAFDAGVIDDPIRAIKEVIKTRTQAAEKRAGGKEVKTSIKSDVVKARETVKKSKIEPQTWEDFVSNLEC